MARGKRTEFDPRRRPLGRPRPAPYFQLGDSASQVAEDWAMSPASELARYASSGVASEGAIKEVDTHLSRGDTAPQEKERLSNLRKHIELNMEES